MLMKLIKQSSLNFDRVLSQHPPYIPYHYSRKLENMKKRKKVSCCKCDKHNINWNYKFLFHPSLLFLFFQCLSCLDSLMIIFTETLIIINIEKNIKKKKKRKEKKTSNMILMTFKNKMLYFFFKNVNEGKEWKRRRNGIKYEKHKDKE